MLALSANLWMLFAARIIGGILSAANMPTVQAYVADITADEERGKGMGIIGAATGLGFICGPAIGGVFTNINLQAPFYISGILSFLTMILVLFVLKESIHLSTNKATPKNKLSWAKVFVDHYRCYIFCNFYFTVVIRSRSNVCLFCSRNGRTWCRHIRLYFYDYGTG